MIETGVRSAVDAFGQRIVAPMLQDDDPGELEPYDCVACREPTGRVCFMCNKPFCEDHTEFFNDEGWAICARCLAFMVRSSQEMVRRLRAQRPQRPPPPPPPGASGPVRSGPPPWEVLGVKPHSDLREVRKAYHRVCMDCHPDRHPNDPAKLERFKQATEAYNVMKDALDAQQTQGARP
jgi:hypothetical protein